MQEKSYNDLLNSAFDKSLDNPKKVKEKIRDISMENHRAMALALNQVEDERAVIRIPSEGDLEEIRQFMVDYSKEHPNASKREVRIAAQKKYRVKIFRKPYRRGEKP
jgi:PHP family Zn ribbon phosphoesterase